MSSDKKEEEDVEDNQRLMRRAQFVQNHGDLQGDLVMLNEGQNYREMDPYYYEITYGDGGIVKAGKLSNKQVFTQVHGRSENEYRKFMRKTEGVDIDISTGDKEWMQGVLEELPSEHDFMLEFEYLLGETAVATKQVEETPELREEWVFNYSPEYVVLTGKLEFRDRFTDEPWERVGEFTGVKETEEQEVEGMEGVPQTVLNDFNYEVVSSKTQPDMLDDNPEVLKTAVEGFLDREYSDGDHVSASVQVLPENKDVFRLVIGDKDMIYYVFEPVEDVGLDFRMPNWCTAIFRADDYV